MPILEPKDPLDADPKIFSVRVGEVLQHELKAIASKRGLSVNEVINQLAKWGLQNRELVKAKDPYDLRPKNLSLRMGRPLRKELEKLAALKRMRVSELIIEVLKLGLREEKK